MKYQGQSYYALASSVSAGRERPHKKAKHIDGAMSSSLSARPLKTISTFGTKMGKHINSALPNSVSARPLKGISFFLISYWEEFQRELPSLPQDGAYQ